ncbi:carotenoid ester lipase [Coprinopsis marcescibilis]|uniref:Carboxylic ester hydrolase n=1 Tax=Coprinopsis marcescibilis TaxID=230819 RepID=A0A5C3KUT9_COPMA|nr:carotenoid ester lipase [Coprinopsis marcescibilis]
MLLLHLSLLNLALVVRSQVPIVTLDQATVIGVQNGTVEKFLGIPYAEPPVGDLRFKLPVNISSYEQGINATEYGFTCISQNSTTNSDLIDVVGSIAGDIIGHNQTHTAQDEDCLTVNVIRPSNINGSLPVLVWIYGGGFEGGSSVQYDQMTTSIVSQSVEIGKPLVLVSMNYRVSAFGFISSQEVQRANVSNIGLYDQRAALHWVKRYISAFGGNSSHVTIWGQSAGAISASLQMLAFDGNSEDLFHAAFMQSGSPIPVGNITGGQPYYDFLVSNTGCSGSNDTISCLRDVPLSNLTEAINQTPGLFSYQSLVLAWAPRVDGVFLTDLPQRLIRKDKVAKIPVVSGNVDDEVEQNLISSQYTILCMSDQEFREYVSTIWLPGASPQELEPLWEAYPSNPADGSPFNTSFVSAITPQYKRMAAFQGDTVFQAPRRYFLHQQAGKQPVWSYLSKRLKYLPILGSFHASDLYLNLLNEYVIYFANNFDPNTGNTTTWPQYTIDSPDMLAFPPTTEGNITVIKDLYRVNPMQILTNLSLKYPL